MTSPVALDCTTWNKFHKLLFVIVESLALKELLKAHPGGIVLGRYLQLLLRLGVMFLLSREESVETLKEVRVVGLLRSLEELRLKLTIPTSQYKI